MKMRFLFFFLALTSIGFISCSDEKDCDEFANENFLQAEAEAIINTAFEYAFNPSDENCQKLRDAYSDFLDLAEEFQGCADEAGQGEEYRADLEEAREALNDLPC